MSASTRWKVGALAVATVAVAAVAGGGPDVAAAQERAQEREDRERLERWTPEVRVFRSGGAWLGVGIDEVDEEAVSELGLPEERGARVLEVVEESPAAEAGLQEGDVIWRWNGEPVESAAELRRLVGETPAGRAVSLEVYRAGASRELSVELTERGGAEMRAQRLRGPRMRELRDRIRSFRGPEGDAMSFFFARPRVRLGVELRDLTDGLEDYFGVADRGGALVASVADGSPAAEAGLRAGDVILSVADEEVSRPSDVIRALREREAGPVEIRVMRRGEERTLTAELEEREDAEEGEEGAWWFDLDRGGGIAAPAPAALPRAWSVGLSHPPAPDAPRVRPHVWMGAGPSGVHPAPFQAPRAPLPPLPGDGEVIYF